MARMVGTVPLCPMLPAWLIMHMWLIICISDAGIIIFPVFEYLRTPFLWADFVSTFLHDFCNLAMSSRLGHLKGCDTL